MPHPIIDPKNTGKSFSDISKDIQKRYEERYDPISQRGLMAEMESLREEQEYRRAKEMIKQELEAMMQPQDPNAAVNPMVTPEMGPNNMGIVPELPQQEQPGTFNREASQSYNQQFAYGGKMKKYANGGPWDDLNESLDMNLINIGVDRAINPVTSNQPVNTPQAQQGLPSQQGVNPMRYAPIAGNLFNILAARRPVGTTEQMRRMGYDTSVDPSIATRTTPTQTQFQNIDMAPVERGIHRAARGFTASNVGASGGDAGAFRANELANQGNILNAIAQARLQGQQMDQQTAAMNAQEQARIDQMKQQQAMAEAGIRGQNVATGMQIADLDARDRGAFATNLSQNIAGITQSIGNIGREQDMMDMVANSLGYTSFGEYVNTLPPNRRNDMWGFINNIIGTRRKG